MVGSILLILGIAAERSGQPAFNFLMIGIACMLVGFLVWNKLRPRQKRPRRFSLFGKGGEEEGNDRKNEIGWEDHKYD